MFYRGAYTRDHGGRLAEKTETIGGIATVEAYSYDLAGRLTGVSRGGAPVAGYTYDLNRRLVNGVASHGFLYQGQLRPIAELDGAGTLVSRFVYGARAVAPEYLIRGGVTYRLVTDQLGSVRLVVNTTTGAIIQRLDYDAFGQVTTDTNPGFQPFGHAGGLYDPLTGFEESMVGRRLLIRISEPYDLGAFLD